MLEAIRKTLLATLGAASFSRESFQGIIDDLVRRGELTQEQSRRLLEELVSRSRSESRLVADRLAREVMRLLHKSPFVTRRELGRLERRVKALEAALGARAPDEVEPLRDSAGPPAGGAPGP